MSVDPPNFFVFYTVRAVSKEIKRLFPELLDFSDFLIGSLYIRAYMIIWVLPERLPVRSEEIQENIIIVTGLLAH
jgi:hypothetical protein